MTAAGTCERDVTSNSSASHHVRLCSRFGLRPEAHAQMGCMLSREYLLHARTVLWLERVLLEEGKISACYLTRMPELVSDLLDAANENKKKQQLQQKLATAEATAVGAGMSS